MGTSRFSRESGDFLQSCRKQLQRSHYGTYLTLSESNLYARFFPGGSSRRDEFALSEVWL